MDRIRRSILITSAVVVLAGAALYVSGEPTISGRFLSHGYGYADCPVGLSFDASPNSVQKSGTVTVEGQLVPEPGADVAGETIAIKRIPSGEFAEVDVLETITDGSGFFSDSFALTETSFVLARWDGTASCSALSSGENVIAFTFADVPPGKFGFDEVETIFAAGITSGCATGPLRFCPDRDVTRGQEAVFLLRAMGHGASAHLPAFRGIFADVPASHPFARFIEHLHDHGITSGCATGPLRFCPDREVSRAVKAVFLVRAFGL